MLSTPLGKPPAVPKLNYPIDGSFGFWLDQTLEQLKRESVAVVGISFGAFPLQKHIPDPRFYNEIALQLKKWLS